MKDSFEGIQYVDIITLLYFKMGYEFPDAFSKYIMVFMYMLSKQIMHLAKALT